jgi:hypothetical protein
MLTDREAEHIPGCNMAFYKWALDEIKGFDPIFRKAGDDVDLCWRLQERGYKIGFSAAGFVWHYRRATVKAYLRQQAGYGEAEALLVQKHPEYFNVLGGGIWHGRIYAAGLSGILLQSAVIYHGVFGSGFFQKLYAREPSFALMFCTSLQFQLFVTLPLLLAGSWFTTVFPVAIAALVVSFSVCIAAASQASIPTNHKRIWSRPLIALLFFLQPLVRGWARYKSRLHVTHTRISREPTPKVLLYEGDHLCFSSRRGIERYTFIEAIRQHFDRAGWQHRLDSGWDEFDIEIATSRWAAAQLTTVHEELSQGRRFFRCRIDTRSSWWTRLLMSLLVLVCCVAVIFFRDEQPFIWFALALLPMALLFFADEQRFYCRQIAARIAIVAHELGLVPWTGESVGD